MRIDVHTHLVPHCFWDGIATKGNWYGATVEQAGGQEYVSAVGRRAGPVEPAWRAAPEARLRDMDATGIDVQVLSIATYLTNYHLDAKQALASSREVNAEMAAIVRAHPKRFVGLATVPLQDPAMAVEVLHHAVHDLGLKGVELATNVDGRNYDDPAFAPFFAAAEKLGAFVFFHPHAPAAADRLSKYYLANLVGFPLETAITLATIIFGGVLDRFPDLKLCFPHGGGYGCYGIGRLDHGFAVRAEPKVTIAKPPSEYLQRCSYDCIVHSYPALDLLLGAVGPDNVLLGSDYPFDMGFADPVGWLSKAPKLSATTREKILGGNAARLLGLPAK